eukprot:TRINITY_DN3534_c0_g1_i3.p1 TRINITY_DN3534_c0_g1~~TRINITY_DN3534_c0_g1_i3.p1  ORF type:complete len:169 (+),score=57.58 TRINITY_DN3534_c0_g1_i3:291-797(+)
MQTLPSATSVDDVLRQHADFLDSCLVQCTLTDPRLVKLVARLLAHCLKFAQFVETFLKELSGAVDAHRAAAAATVAGAVGAAAATDDEPVVAQFMSVHGGEFYRMLGHLDASFMASLFTLLSALQAESQRGSNPGMAHLYACLDYNGFYAEYRERHAELQPVANVPKV